MRSLPGGAEVILFTKKLNYNITIVEEINNEIALKNYSDLSSGKSLPFANLDEKMVKKDKK